MKGATRGLERGMTVQIDDVGVFSGSTEPNWTDAVVIDLLSSMFTCTIGARTEFRFYRERDNTWRFK